MKRTSTSIEVVTENATTWLPWVGEMGVNRCDGYPDFSGFNEPTLSVLAGAWQAFLDSGEPLEIIPDPAPSVPSPNFSTLLDLLNSDTPFPGGDLSPYDQLYEWTALTGGLGARYSTHLGNLQFAINQQNEQILKSAVSRLKQQTSQGQQQFTATQLAAIDAALSAANFTWGWADA